MEPPASPRFLFILTPSESATAPTAIDIPRGARIEVMTAGTDRLILDLALPDDRRQFVVIDLVTGVRLGTIELRTAP